jgi:hypothetical protein
LYSFELINTPFRKINQWLGDNDPIGALIAMSLILSSLFLAVFINPFFIKLSDTFVFYNSVDDFMGKTAVLLLCGTFYPVTITVLYGPIWVILALPLLVKKYVFRLE